jgi:hypothetical protein
MPEKTLSGAASLEARRSSMLVERLSFLFDEAAAGKT